MTTIHKIIAAMAVMVGQVAKVIFKLVRKNGLDASRHMLVDHLPSLNQQGTVGYFLR